MPCNFYHGKMIVCEMACAEQCSVFFATVCTVRRMIDAVQLIFLRFYKKTPENNQIHQYEQNKTIILTKEYQQSTQNQLSAAMMMEHCGKSQ